MQLGERFRVFTAPTIQDGLDVARDKGVDLILLDVGLSGEDGIEGISRIKDSIPATDIVMISGRRDPKTVVRAMKAGAGDYLTKPLDCDEFEAVYERIMSSRRMKERYEAMLETQCGASGDLVFCSDSMAKVLSQASQLKGHNANVLIVGATGTGKELLAKHIHRIEEDPARPFIAVNCAAIPDNLLEAELFGAEPGAFTGATRRRIGKFELADGGDIFLDEIGALKLDMQAKILRVIQEKEFSRLGGNELIRSDFRLIAATNDSIEEKVASGEFRMDLYHRIRVIQLKLPPLSERRADIPYLAEYFLKRFSRGNGEKKITERAMERLSQYSWPGNVRELSNVIHSLTILTDGPTIDLGVFPPWILNGCSHVKEGNAVVTAGDVPTSTVLRECVANAEKSCIEEALRVSSGDRSKAARFLKVGRTTLYAKMKELGIR
jgi:DNA-binding NtrC family response regulator